MTAPRYTVRTDRLPKNSAVAWISDAQRYTAISWHYTMADAERVCAALNAADQREQAERALAVHANVMEF